MATIREASRQATQRKIDENNQAVDRLRADLVMLQETSDELLRIARMTQSTLQELHSLSGNHRSEENGPAAGRDSPAASPPVRRACTPIRSLVATVDLAEKLSDPALDECQRDGVYAVAVRTVAEGRWPTPATSGGKCTRPSSDRAERWKRPVRPRRASSLFASKPRPKSPPARPRGSGTSQIARLTPSPSPLVAEGDCDSPTPKGSEELPRPPAYSLPPPACFPFRSCSSRPGS